MFHIYGLIDPRQPDRERYIGLTSQPIEIRLKQHLYYVKRGRKHHYTSWLRKLIEDGVKPEIKLLDVADTEADGNFVEKLYILIYRMCKVNLTNMTLGGDGMRGHKMTAEQRQRISKGRRAGKVAQMPKRKGPYKGRAEYGTAYAKRISESKASE